MAKGKSKASKSKKSEGVDNLKTQLVKDALYLKSNTKWRFKLRNLALLSRRTSGHARLLLKNLLSMTPNCKSDNKIDCHRDMEDLVELADANNCQQVAWIRTTKKKDYYLHMAQAPSGPAAKFRMSAIHAIETMKTTGNALQYSRAVLSFSSSFSASVEGKVIMGMLSNFFNVPLYHPKSKPFVDRIVHCYLEVGTWKVRVRHYHVLPSVVSEAKRTEGKVKSPIQDIALTEIGPRFTLQLITIQGGPFCGPILFKNDSYMSPTLIRRTVAVSAAQKTLSKLRHVEGSMIQKAEALENDDEMAMGAIFSDVETETDSE